MFSVTPEPAVSNSAYGPQAKQPRTDQPPSDGFAALVESNANAASDSRSAPDAPLPPRRDQHDARRSDTPSPRNDGPRSDASSASNNNPSSAQHDTDPSAPPKETTAGGDKTPGKVKASGDKKSDSEKTQDGDSAVADPTVSATVTDAVAVVVAVVTAPVATPGSGDGASSTPAAIAASAAAAATAVIAAAASPASQTDPALAQTPTAAETAGTASDAAAELIAAAPAEAAPDATATQVTTSAGALNSAAGKAEASAKHAETAAAAKESKDGKQAVDKSSVTTVTDQAVKPETGASDADGKPGQHDKAATSGTETSGHAGKTASQGEHHAAPAPLAASQPDPGSQSPAFMPQQPVQTHAANLTAIPVAPAQTALADTPVPLNSLAADIALRAAGGSSRFEIRLDPAELGRIDVRLDVDKHGNVTSHLTVERPATLDMLRNDAPRLQQALEDAGLKTGDSGLQFSLRDQSSSGQNNDNGSGRNSQRVIITDEDTVPAQVAGRTYGRMLGSSSGVDIRI